MKRVSNVNTFGKHLGEKETIDWKQIISNKDSKMEELE